MENDLENAVLNLYKEHDDKTKTFKNPEIINGFGASDRFGWKPYGWSHYAMFHLLEPVLSETNGDICEIGAHKGNFSVILLEFANITGKRLYIIDPWNGQQQGGQKEKELFYQRVNKYDTNNLTVYEMKSQDALKEMKEMNLCFAWVDGLHTHEAVTQDLANIKTAFKGKGIIGTDDVRGEFHYNKEIMRAMWEANDSKWKHVKSPETCIFSFLVKE